MLRLIIAILLIGFSCSTGYAAAAAIYRVNCGGSEPFADSAGHTWQRDRIHAPGKTVWGRTGGNRANRVEQAEPGETIDIQAADTPDIYRSETYGDHTYFFKLQPGRYLVRLHFAETFTGCTGPGYRVFSVRANSQPLLADFDVCREAGDSFTAVVKQFEVDTEGDLQVRFESGNNPAIINAIEILGPAQPDRPSPPPSGSVFIHNDSLKVELDRRYPVLRGYELLGSGLRFEGNTFGDDEDAPLHEKIFQADLLRHGKPAAAEVKCVSSESDSDGWAYTCLGECEGRKAFSFRVKMCVEESALCVRIGDVREEPGFELMALRFVRYRPLCLTGDGDDAFLGVDNDLKLVSGTPPNVWRNVPYALLSADSASAAVYCNQIDPGGPLEVSVFNTTDGRRAAGIGPHTYHHRVKNVVMPDFEMKIGLVADHNRDGEANWLDAANWLGEQIPCEIPDFYSKAHIDKYFMCIHNQVSFSVDQCRQRMQQLYHLTNGSPHIAYLVGWQYDGHDSEYPAMDVVNQQIGGRDKLINLMNDGPDYNFNFSFHFNFDDAYKTSPAWDPSMVCVGGDGELVKGGVWGGAQSYTLCPYKLVKSGEAKRMVDRLVELYPLRDTIHLDVFSAVPYRASHDKDDPSGFMDNLVLGKLEIMRIFAQRGIDVTSEWATYPFVGPMTYFWHAGMIKPGNFPINAAILHGRVLYGGWLSGLLSGGCDFIPEYLAYGGMVDQDYTYATPLETVLDIEYLLDSVLMMYNRRPMTGYVRRGNIVRVDYGPGTYVKWNSRTNEYQVWVDGKRAAENFACIVPTRGGHIIYSRDARAVRFPLPESLCGRELSVVSLHADGTRSDEQFELAEDAICIDARAHTPYLITPQRR